MEAVYKEIGHMREVEIMCKFNNVLCFRFFIILNLLFFSLNVSSKEKLIQVHAKILVEPTKEWLVYHPERPLSISDFRGNVQKDIEASALIYSGVNMTYKVFETKEKVSVFIEVSAYMDPNQSWMRKSGKNEKVLDHEQRHFDLTALAACQLVERIKKAKFTENWRKELHQLYAEEIESKLQRLQKRYDKDTFHGINRKAQKSYNEFIENQLEQSDCFP